MNDYILTCTDNHKLADTWINGKYKIKPLLIYGNPGTGKTSIAKHILKDRTIVHITSDLCKTNTDFEEYLNLSLYKKSITMMFSDNNIYKALIIDDLTIIQTSDKKLYKSILVSSKKKVNNNPIIYILDKINHKSLINLRKNSFQMNISYSKNDLIMIIKKYLSKIKLNKESINELIQNSNYNLHNIIINLDFYKGDFTNMNRYENNNIELSDYINKIITMDNFVDIYRYSENDFNIINLNLLENLNKTLNFKKKEHLIYLDNIYKNSCISDNILTYIHYNNNWNSIEHQITFGILYPVLQIKRMNKEKINFEYNKYISKCIIYTYNNKLLNNDGLNGDILSYLYYLIKEYTNVKSLENMNNLKRYIEYYTIPLKVIEKFMKYYQNIYYLLIEKKSLRLFIE